MFVSIVIPTFVWVWKHVFPFLPTMWASVMQTIYLLYPAEISIKMST